MDKEAFRRIGLVVNDELARAIEKFPEWPNDLCHALAIVGEEFGELQKAVLEYLYDDQKPAVAGFSDIREEALQLAAVALRFIAGIEQYDWIESDQHSHVEGLVE